MEKREVKFIRPVEVKNLINTIKKGKFFSLFFERVAPKCPHCNKSNKKWKGLTHCPICGTELSLERESIAQLGIYNPRDNSIAPKGTGISAKEALEDNLLKYYDTNAEGKGGYRTARIENIRRITYEGVDYFVSL
ncbi:MAG: hypothetical protein IKP65_01980 [Alphaproteobacteria bacterium]|nr:hypothetical protein [Alphaproteobacteria bacterium]